MLQLTLKTFLLTVSCPGFQPAGQTSPCLSVYWKAWTSLKVSSTLLPTGKSFIVIWRRIPLGSIMNKPLRKIQLQRNIHSIRWKTNLNVCPKSSRNTPYALEMLWFKSESNGMFTFPKPPSFLGVWIQARWVKCESTEHATTSVFILRNSSILSLNARISVGHTNVLKSQLSTPYITKTYGYLQI